MTIFDSSEKVEYIATQTMHYDRYCSCRYFLERVDVQGKYGLVCEEELENCGTHSHVILPPIYNEIHIRKISSAKAIYDKYVVFANGREVGQFTLGLNEWVPRTAHKHQNN
jgi:hypothetical protein